MYKVYKNRICVPIIMYAKYIKSVYEYEYVYVL
jgi:hypothetical protein